jgi:hypothetical protein
VAPATTGRNGSVLSRRQHLEGQHNALGDFGYPRDGKRGKLQIVIGLLTDSAGEPLAVRVFSGNTGDPVTVVDQIKILETQFGVQELVFVGDRGMVKSKGKQALQAAGLHYISALTDPQIRRLLGDGTLQMDLFHEEVCEVEADGLRFRSGCGRPVKSNGSVTKTSTALRGPFDF